MFILGLIALFVLYSLGMFKNKQAGILVDSDPVSEVFINGELKGNTPYEGFHKAEEIRLKIRPVDSSLSLDDYETKIDLTPGVRTIVKRVFRLKDEESSHVMVSFEEIKPNETSAVVISVPDGAEVKIDGRIYGQTPLRVNINPGDHELSVYSSGYFEKKLPIKAYKGYKLTAFVKLSKDVPQDSSMEMIVNETLQITIFKVKIKERETSVRSGANIGFPEISIAKKDEIYAVAEEGENGKWYKIILPDGKYGWIESSSASRI